MVKMTIPEFFFFTYFEDFYEIKPVLIFFSETLSENVTPNNSQI